MFPVAPVSVSSESMTRFIFFQGKMDERVLVYPFHPLQSEKALLATQSKLIVPQIFFTVGEIIIKRGGIY